MYSTYVHHEVKEIANRNYNAKKILAYFKELKLLSTHLSSHYCYSY